MTMLHIRPPSTVLAVSVAHDKVDTDIKATSGPDSLGPRYYSCMPVTSTEYLRNIARLVPLKAPPTSPLPSQHYYWVETILTPAVAETVASLLLTYGLSCHNTFLDPGFSIYLSHSQPSPEPGTAPDAAICFKPLNGVAVMYGDPLCAPSKMEAVFDAFCAFARERKWHVAAIEATTRFADLAVRRGWGALEFAAEAVLNPTTNVIAAGKGCKTVQKTNRRLDRAGWKVEVYDPAGVAGGKPGRVPALEAELSAFYKEWRERRAARGTPQSYVTVVEPWEMPGQLTRHLYVRCPETRQVVGFATLVRCGGVNGYLIDPLVAGANAPRGVTEFLTTYALRMLRDEGSKHLTFGIAPMNTLGSARNISTLVDKPLRALYEMLARGLRLGGKGAWHEKWRPERSERSALIFPPGGVGAYIKVTMAICWTGNISFMDVVGDMGQLILGKRAKGSEAEATGEKVSDGLDWNRPVSVCGWQSLMSEIYLRSYQGFINVEHSASATDLMHSIACSGSGIIA